MNEGSILTAMLACGPTSKAGDAVRAILVEQLQEIRRNESGAIRSLDPEFLHDFRVAVRRTRVAVGEMHSVLAADAVARFRPELSWLGKFTGPARDLDVLALTLPGRMAGLSPDVRRRLQPLVRRLDLELTSEHRQLSASLEGPRYRKLMDSWSEYLHAEPHPESEAWRPPEAAAEPIEVAAARWIDRARRRVLDRGDAITAESPLKALHQLRLECKKLRYLLEFFRALFDVEGQIRGLKRLQNTLGVLNDYRVQRRLLKRLALDAGIVRKSRGAGKRALRPLLKQLKTGVALERAQFSERFSRFRTTV